MSTSALDSKINATPAPRRIRTNSDPVVSTNEKATCNLWNKAKTLISNTTSFVKDSAYTVGMDNRLTRKISLDTTPKKIGAVTVSFISYVAVAAISYVAASFALAYVAGSASLSFASVSFAPVAYNVGSAIVADLGFMYAMAAPRE